MGFCFDLFSTWLRFGPVWWSKLELCWGLDTIQEAKKRQIAKMARNGTAPQRELNSEGLAGLKMRAESTKNPTKKASNIDEKSARILTSKFHGFLVDVGWFQGPKLDPSCF